MPINEIMGMVLRCIGFSCIVYVLFNSSGVSTTELSCHPNPAALCDSSILLCECFGVGMNVKWTTSKTDVFAPPVGKKFSGELDHVGESRLKDGFILTFTNDDEDNFTSILQVNATNVNGIQVNCTVGMGETKFVTPRLAGTCKLHVYRILGIYMYM